MRKINGWCNDGDDDDITMVGSTSWMQLPVCICISGRSLFLTSHSVKVTHFLWSLKPVKKQLEVTIFFVILLEDLKYLGSTYAHLLYDLQRILWQDEVHKKQSDCLNKLV